MQEVDRECTHMCSLKEPSCLRSPTKKDLERFSFEKVNKELETKAPFLSAVLWTASLRKSKREDGGLWTNSVCMAAGVLLKNRSPCMNALQLLNTIILYHTGITVSYDICCLFNEISFFTVDLASMTSCVTLARSLRIKTMRFN